MVTFRMVIILLLSVNFQWTYLQNPLDLQFNQFTYFHKIWVKIKIFWIYFFLRLFARDFSMMLLIESCFYFHLEMQKQKITKNAFVEKYRIFPGVVK